MRRPFLNLTVLVIILTLNLSFVAFLPATSQDKREIISKLEKLRGMVEGEHPSLENKVNAVIHQIEAGAYNGALNKMVNDVNKTITMWVENPAELYELVNKIVNLIKGITPPPPPPLPDFKISAEPDELGIVQNSSGTSTVKVTSLHGFTQRINVSAVLTPATDKVTLSLDPTWVIPTPSGNTSKLTVAVAANAKAREYVISVAGTNGTLQHSVNITLLVTALKDFSMEASPASLAIPQGGSNISVITVTSLEGFSQTVNLTITSQPIPHVNATLYPLQVFPKPNYPAISILTINVTSAATLGSCNITVQGSSGPLKHSVNVVLKVTAPPVPPTPDFAIAASPTSLIVQQGDTDKSTIIIASLKGFSKPVVLRVTPESILSVKLTLDPSEVTPPSNLFVTSILTIEVAINASPGQHMVTVAGTSGDLQHSVNISLTVVVEETPPIIVSVLRQPEEPSYNQTVAVFASVTDVGSGVKDVVISYSGGTTWKNESMTSQDGLYKGFIPAFAFNTSVGYRVYASDNVGNWAVPSSVYSYVVADPYPPVVGTPSWSPEEPAANEEITVSVIVTEPPFSSGVKDVALWYGNKTVDDWVSVSMAFMGGNWTAAITNQSDTFVRFFVEASDNAGNMADSEVQEFTVAAPTGVPLAWILLIIVILAVLAGSAAYLLLRRRQRRRGAGAAPPIKPAPPSPPPVTRAEKPAEPREAVAPVRGYGMVSFVVPAHNEEGTISQRITKAYERAASHAGPSEIIVVDDGSLDNTYEAAWSAIESNRKRWPNIPAKVVKLSANLGREEAVRVASNKATGETVETVNGENALAVSGSNPMLVLA